MKIRSAWRVIPGFKIRSKGDVQRFLDDCLKHDGEWLIKIASDQLLIIEKIKGFTHVSFKYGDLADVFNPQLQIDDRNVIDALYMYRKYLNAYFFAKD